MNAPLSRRQLLGRSLGAGAGVLFLPALGALAQAAESMTGAPAAEEVATGYVFDDRGSTGVRSDGSPGIEGVLVSNGRSVVRTDRDGRYRIGVRDGDVLFVVKPAHWATPLSEYNLPKFYYFHRPTGSPQWRAPDAPATLDPTYYYAGTDATGPLPASIDFPLRKHAEPDEFKVVVFGDTQVSHDRQVEWMSRDTIAELVGTNGVAFGISLGDLVNVGLLHMYQPLNEMQAKTGFPWYVIPGNHDQNIMVPDDSLADEQFRTTYGPTTYAFDYGPASFLMLENIMRRPVQGYNTSEDGQTSTPMGDNYGCGLTDDQWAFVESYLAAVPLDRPLFIAMHIPITGENDDEKAFCKRLMGLLSGRRCTLSMSGHTHRQRHTFHGEESGFSGPGQHHHFNSICVRGEGYRGMFDELRIPTCQSVCGTPNGYSFLFINKDGYSIRYKGSRERADYQMNIFVSPRIRTKDLGRQLVRANVFAGSERSTVRMRVNGGSWLPMDLTPEQDPSMKWVLESQVKPESWLRSKYRLEANDLPLSYHIWQAPLPTEIAVGTHTLEVESTDMFGQSDRGVTLFRVTA
ncbi:MAG TPA: calcineurin-like phosphoesterase C-terminal domain-containing protein [Tepidisphaeraceae bacterium]|jgi:hypothetical protein|nr:calcineurin-like phosphoesterase C-terminal domain-containing protein [Tepidisphaeraceae bacterium]